MRVVPFFLFSLHKQSHKCSTEPGQLFPSVFLGGTIVSRDPAGMRRNGLPLLVAAHKYVSEAEGHSILLASVLSTGVAAAGDDRKALKGAHLYIIDLTFQKTVGTCVEVAQHLLPGRHATVSVSHHPVRSE